MMPFLKTYIDNLVCDWKFNRAALNAMHPTHEISLQANAKQEQIINDLKTLYDACYQQLVYAHNEHCRWYCGYLYQVIENIYPMLTNQFNLHLTRPIHLQTGYHGCFAD